ncbi:MAG: endonuclease/exonuclease/phosphatase family protein [archaeon]
MVRLILYNVEYLSGCKGRIWEYLLFWKRFFHPRKVEEKVCNEISKFKPGIVALVEVDKKSFIFGRNYLETFKQKLGMGFGVEKRKYHFVGLFKILKYIPLFKNNANAIFSKRKIYEPEFFYFSDGFKRAVMKVSINVPEKVSFILLHLSLGEEARKKQFNELVKIIKEIKGPLIVMGDFNTYKGEEEVEILLKKTGLKHKFKLSSTKRTFTFPTYNPHRRLDYILTSPEIKVKKYDILKFDFSDHLPVLVDFSVRKKKK